MVAVVAVEARGLSHMYGDLKALDGVNLQVRPAEVYGLLGPNGGGKSTFFRIVSTLLPATSGDVLVYGHSVRTQSDVVRRQLGVTFQSPSLDLKLTVSENLRCHGMLLGLRGVRLRQAVAWSAEQLGIADRGGDRAEALSGGLRRRVEVAKAMLGRPGLLLLDEPATGLDPGARLGMWEAFQRLRGESGVTILLTTHLMEEAEKCDRLGILDRGRLLAEGTPDDLRDSIGGDCLTVRAADPAVVARELESEFGVRTRVVGELVRVEAPEAARLVPLVVDRFGDRVRSVSVARPTLEDVFVHNTGRSFDEAVA